MGEIKTLADDAFRDMESPGSSTPHEPVKSEIRGVFDQIDADVEAFEGVVLSGRIEKATYAALAAIVPAANGTAGAVLPTDTGTHTDPVVGGTVANSGVYSYSTSPAGWERIGAYQGLSVASQAEVDAGTDNAKAVTALTLLNAKSTKRTFIEIEYVSGPANNMVWRPANPRDNLTGTGTQYRFSGIMPFDSLSSMSVAITQYDGTPFLAALSVRAPDGTSQVASVLKHGDRFEMIRNSSPLGTYEVGVAGLFRLLTLPGFGLDDLLPTAHAVDASFGMPVSDDRPVSLRQVEENLYIIREKMLWPDHYSGSVGFSHADFFQAAMFDMKDFQSNVPDGALCFNSFFASVGAVNQAVTNLQFRTLDVLTTDVGQVPSTFEPPFFVLESGAGVGTAVAAGIGHGYMEDTACSIIGTLEGVDTANLYGGDQNITFNGDKVVSTVTGFITTSAGAIVAGLEYVDTYEPTADYHFRCQVTYDFGVTAQEVVPATTGAGSYCMPVPIQNMNRIVGFLNGVRVTGVGSSVNGIHTIDLKDTTVTNIGIVDEVICWNSDYPEIQIVITNLIGQGKSCRINGVVQTATVNSGVQNNVWGAKFLGTPVYNLGATELEIADDVFEFDYGIRIQRAEPIT